MNPNENKDVSGNKQLFKAVNSRVDFPEMERELLEWWGKADIMSKYLNRNQYSEKRWSFIDGPITANNPMGVHHAWGRAYKLSLIHI